MKRSSKSESFDKESAQSRKSSETSLVSSLSVGDGLGDIPSAGIAIIEGQDRPIRRTRPPFEGDEGMLDEDGALEKGYNWLNKSKAGKTKNGNKDTSCHSLHKRVSNMSIPSKGSSKSASMHELPEQRIIPLQPPPLVLPLQKMKPFSPFANRPVIALKNALNHNIGFTGANGKAEEELDPVAVYLHNGLNSRDVERRSVYNPKLRSILWTCWQNSPVPMDILFDPIDKIKKIGEGVYGEVFKGTYTNPKSMRVFKIVPMGGSKKVNGETQKTFEDMESEIIISQEVTKLVGGYRKSMAPCYCKLYAARVGIGKYPEKLLQEWTKWNEHHKSDNDKPKFELNQHYAIFEYEYAGSDLESFVFKSARQAFSLLMQVTHTLAAGEAALAFEHRDLHWGNILVEETEDEYIEFIINDLAIGIPSFGIKATIIDFTLARLTDSYGKPIFCDLKKDEEQFTGLHEALSEDDYQFDVYRMMKKHNGHNWITFTPKTNIFWSHYIVDKLLCKAHFSDKRSYSHLKYVIKLRELYDKFLNYSSCFDFVTVYAQEVERAKREAAASTHAANNPVLVYNEIIG